jgi:hypothetical protein
MIHGVKLDGPEVGGELHDSEHNWPLSALVAVAVQEQDWI